MAAPPSSADDLIEELVHQFSDPFAFYRELIQNSIDAGSSRIEVSLRYRPGSGEGWLAAEVADWGEGMDRAIIEQYLVTKFRSTKEGDLTKIGKFGIGFLSVFAPGPELVVVETGRDGEDWRVLFHPDRSYELLRCPEPVEGTRVVLHKQMPPVDYREFVARSAESVRRWCRHSEAEVAFAAGGEDGSAPGPVQPVREPLLADAPFQVEERDERTRIVAGPARSAPPLVGFYNRGLTLLETREALVPGVSFKVVSDLLEHTLSRDDVKREREFERVLARVGALARGPIRQRLAGELSLAARAPERADDYLALLGHARAEMSAEALVFPGVAGVVEGRALRSAARELGCVVVGEPGSRVVQALQRQGAPVLDPPKGQRDAVLTAVREALALPVRRADEAFVVCEAGPALPVQAAFLEELARLLGTLGARVAGVDLGTLHGAAAGRLLVVAPGLDLAVPAELATSSPFRAEPGLRLVLNRYDARVREALGLAASRPRLAAYLCARLVAVVEGALDEEADGRLSQAALAP